MSIGYRLRFDIFKRDKFTCQYCGRHPPDIELCLDHVRPRATGGDDGFKNLVTSCMECNTGKSDIPLEENYRPRSRNRIPSGYVSGPPITIKDASEEHGLPRHRFHQWLHTGHLKRIGRLKGQGKGGIVLLDAEAVAALVAHPPKEGRPPGRKTRGNSSKSGTETT